MIDTIIITKKLSLLSWLIVWFGDKKYIIDYDHVSFRDSIWLNKYTTWSMGGNSSRAPVVSFCWSLEVANIHGFIAGILKFDGSDPATDILQVETNKMEGVLFKEFKKQKKQNTTKKTNEVVLYAFYCKILEIEVKLTQDREPGAFCVLHWLILGKGLVRQHSLYLIVPQTIQWSFNKSDML